MWLWPRPISLDSFGSTAVSCMVITSSNSCDILIFKNKTNTLYIQGWRKETEMVHFKSVKFVLSHSLSFLFSIMPFVDLQGKTGINLDKWILAQSSEQPYKRVAHCHAFEKEWIECSHGIGKTRAKNECKVEFEDFYECMHREKMVSSTMKWS